MEMARVVYFTHPKPVFDLEESTQHPHRVAAVEALRQESGLFVTATLGKKCIVTRRANGHDHSSMLADMTDELIRRARIQ
jgi:hypothetical protein